MKYLLDNNLSPHLAEALDDLSRQENVLVNHLRSKFNPNTPDEDWIQDLSSKGGWTVITHDRRITVEIKAWRESGLVFVILPSKFANLDFWNQAWKIIKIWPEIIRKTKKAKAGTGFKLNANCTKLEKIV